MPNEKFPPGKRGDPIRTEEWNRMRSALERHDRFSFGDGTMGYRGSQFSALASIGGSASSIRSFWAKITGPPPAITSVSDTGGFIPAGTYFILTTYTTSEGKEYSAATAALVTTSTGNSKITIFPPGSIGGVDGWKVYVAIENENGPYGFEAAGEIGEAITLTALAQGDPPPNLSYDWIEQTELANGNFENTDGGLSGTTTEQPAYEVNNVPVRVGSNVRMWFGFVNSEPVGQEFLFSAGGGGGAGGTINVYEVNPFTVPPTHPEIYSGATGISFIEHLFELDPDPITPNVVGVYLRSQNRLIPYQQGGGGWQVMFSGTPADDPWLTAYWTRYPTIFGIQLGVCAAAMNGIIVFGSALSSHVCAWTSHPQPSESALYIWPKDPPKGQGTWNELTIVGNPTGGDFQLEYDGEVSDPIPWNVVGSIEAIPQAAGYITGTLQNVPTIGVGNVMVSSIGPCGGGLREGGGRAAGPFAAINFIGDLGELPVGGIIVHSNLTGGSITATLKSSGDPFEGDQVLKARRLPTGVYQTYWGDAGGGGGLDIHEVNVYAGSTIETFPNVDSFALDTTQFAVEADPLHSGGAIGYLRGANALGEPLPFALMWSGLIDPEPPYAEWSQTPIIHALQLGVPTRFNGELYFQHAGGFAYSVFIASPRSSNIGYLLPVNDPDPEETFSFLAAMPGAGVHQLVWVPGATGGGGGEQDYYEVDAKTGAIVQEWLDKKSLAVDITQIDMQDDPAHPDDGVILYLRGMDENGLEAPYRILHGGDEGATKPYGYWTDFPKIGKGIQVGVYNGGGDGYAESGTVVWASGNNGKTCSISMDDDAGDVNYLLPDIANLADGKFLSVVSQGGNWKFKWDKLGIDVEEGGALKVQNAKTLDFDGDDFVVTDAGDNTARIRTDGPTGDCGPFYKYICEGNPKKLTQYTGYFPVIDGLVKSLNVTYA